MTSTEDRPPSLGERYLTRTRADVLLAAGFAQAGNTRGAMALTLYRAAEDWRANVNAIEQRRGISAEVERMLLAKRSVLMALNVGPPPRAVCAWCHATLASLAPTPLNSDGQRERIRSDFDALSAEAQEVYLLAQRALPDLGSATVVDIIMVVGELLPPPPPPRTLPAELVELHDWSVPELRRQFPRLSPSQASHIAERVLRWFLTDVCESCGGRGYKLLPGTSIRSDALCPDCNGVGRSPVESRLKKSRKDAGRWLASEFAQMLTYVLSEMAARLRPSLDICLDRQPELDRCLVELRSAEAQED